MESAAEPLVGIVNLHKPPGITSRRALDMVVRQVRPAKAGHAGTLDPLAEGVLVICVGRATRLIEHVQRGRKHYRARFLLGRTSPTDDVEGPIRELASGHQPTLADLEHAAAGLVGTILQRPPAFSAIKVGGRRSYDLARRGEAVELAPRPVEVFCLRIERYAWPELDLFLECGGGTYVRAIGRDLAERLGTGAVMSQLVRTRVGNFGIEDSIIPENLAATPMSQWLQPPQAGLPEMPCVELTATTLALLRQGRTARVEQSNVEVAAFTPTGTLAGILGRQADGSYRFAINLVG